jgi:hypothetical protein
MAAFMLSAILVAWLGFAGPLDLSALNFPAPSFDLSELKNWQTLIAAGVALLAAGLAYRGAMAKVNFDREAAQKAELRRKLALLRQLQFVSQEIRDSAEQMCGTWKHIHLNTTIHSGYAWLEFKEPKELSTAWDNLDILPDEANVAINGVRWAIARYELMMNNIKEANDGNAYVYETQAVQLLRHIMDGAEVIRGDVRGELRALGK